MHRRRGLDKWTTHTHGGESIDLTPVLGGWPVLEPNRVVLHIDAMRLRLELGYLLRGDWGWTVPVSSITDVYAEPGQILVATTEGLRTIPMKHRSERTLEETVRRIDLALRAVREPAGREHVPPALSELSRQ